MKSIRPTLSALLLAALLPAAFAQTPAAPAAAVPAKKVDASGEIVKADAKGVPVAAFIKKHESFLARGKSGPIGVLFLGDSITDAWPRKGEYSWLKFAPYNPADFGISGDRTEHQLWRIENGELNGIHPKVVVLMIGTNNIGQANMESEKPEWAAGGVKKIVDTVQQKLPQAKILLLAVFPRGLRASPQRAAVAAINQIISKMDNGSSIRYLDIGAVFLDATGELPPDVMPDKLHPTAKGYDLWYNAMQPLLSQMMR